MNQENIGKFIAECRKKKQITQQELAKKLNVTDKAVSKWENGRCLPDVLLLKPLSKELGITVNDLLSGELVDKQNYEEKFEENIVNTIKYSNERIKKSKKRLIYILISIYIIVTYFGYKLINYSRYKIVPVLSFEVAIGELDYGISSLPTRMDEDKIKYKDLSIRNDFKNFRILKNDKFNLDSKYYVLYVDNKAVASFSLSYEDSYLEMFKSNIDSYKENADGIKYIEDSFFDKNNITNDIEAIKFLKKNKNVKNTIFTSVKNMKRNYNINFLYYSLFYTSVDNINLLDGKYSGYIINLGNEHKEVKIIDNNKLYSLSFKNSNYFTDEYIKELIDTIVIDNL